MKLSSQLCQLALCGLLWRVSTGAPPTLAYFSAYVTVDESTLYIQGGSSIYTTKIAYNQFYSLDLTKSWDTSNPPWSEIPTVGPIPPGLKVWGHSISLSRNQRTLTFWNINATLSYAASFHLDTNSWSELPALSPLSPLQRQDSILLCAATDPTTDRVYIPGGADKGMLVFEPTSGSSAVLSMPPSDKNSTFWSAYTFVWSDVRQSFLYFGGLDYPETSYFYEYKATRANPWSILNSVGAVPPPLGGSCMVSAHDGTKMIVFGGIDYAGEKYSDTLYILDVATLTWSQGAKYQPRLGMVCSVSGDYFIVWGGHSITDDRRFDPISEVPIVYNLQSEQWTTQFIGKKTSSDNSKKNAIIIGSVVGVGVVAILIAGVIVFRRWRRHRHQKKKETQESSLPQIRPEQEIEEESMEKMHFRNVQRPPRATTPQSTFQRTPPVSYSLNTAHSNNPQQGYGKRLQQNAMYHSSRRTSSPPRHIQSLVSSRSTSTLVANPIMTASSRYPSPQQCHFFDPSPPARRATRNPQGHDNSEPTFNSNQKIQHQINALHAEVSRLQAMLDS